MIISYIVILVFAPMLIMMDVQDERRHERELIETCYEMTSNLDTCIKEIKGE